MSELRLGVVGAGHMGANHARAAARQEGARLVAVADTDFARAQAVAGGLGVRALGEHRALLDGPDRVDAAIIAVPTVAHAAVARDFLAARIPILLEKPLAPTAAEAAALADEAARTGTLCQVGHVERWNPAWQAARPEMGIPVFIEGHRLAPFAFRSTDVGVVMDLMIHDLDLVCWLVGAAPTQVDAAGAAILTSREDIVNARLAFPGGCVANLTASRTSERVLRRIRIFSRDRYVAVDLGERKAQVWRKSAALASGHLKPEAIDPRTVTDRRAALVSQLLDVRDLPVADAEPLRLQLDAFCAAVRSGGPSPVPPSDAVAVLRLAEQVLASVGAHLRAAGLPVAPSPSR